MYKLIEAHSLEKDFSYDLLKESSDLCKHLNFDNWKIIMFTEDKLHGFVQYSSDNSSSELYNSEKSICFERLKDHSYLNLVLDERKIVLNINKDNSSSIYNPLSKDALSELYFPLFSTVASKREVCGCFYLSRNSHPEDNIYELLQDKYVISRVINIQRKLNIDYVEYMEDKNFINMIHVFSEITRTREPFMKTHSYNVAFLCNLMGLELNHSSDQLYRLYIAAILHDIGKLYIPESILNKPGELTEIERYEIKRHPIHSFNIVRDLISGIKNLNGIEEIVLQHHERYDGTGYPNGIKGEDIPIESRILAIADSVDAMISERSYKKPRSINNVINQLHINKGKQFDPELAQLMINILVNKQKNQEVILTEPIIIGTIVLSTEKNSCQLQGTLAKTSLGYKFKIDHNECLCTKCTSHMSDIIEATFHTEDNGKIYEYDVTVRYKGNGKIYISKLSPRLSSVYFSLLWELNGSLTFKNSISSEVIISKIGGDFLSFYVDINHFKDKSILNNANTVTIKFEDSTVIVVTGKVVSTIKIGHKLYCDFKYLNILESTRDQIFKQIFKKQAEFRKNIFNAMLG